MAIDPQHVGSLYRKLGMETSPELIASRIEILKSVLEGRSKIDCLALASISFGVRVSEASINWLLEPMREAEPGFASSGIDPEVELLASVILRELIDRTGDFTRWLSLAVETLSFGGQRPLRADQHLVSHARDRLAQLQTQYVPLKNATYRTKADFSETYKPAESNIQWLQAHGIVKQTLQQILDYAAAGLHDQANQLHTVIEATRRLGAQQEIQWWAVAGWSNSADCPFENLSLLEASNRAAIELAALSDQIHGGPHSAPGLINMVISRGRQADQSEPCALADAVIASPISWRKSWAPPAQNELIPALPLTAATHLSIEASDDPYWKAQFKQKLGIDPLLEMTPVKYATQLFRERLVYMGTK